MNQEFSMKKIMIATAALALMCGSASAQNTGPAPQSDNMQKPGMQNEQGSMTRGTTGTTGTAGMTNGTNGMVRGGVQPDASGQGGSGPGSDQGGTRTRNMK
jgi:hypothetical protein